MSHEAESSGGPGDEEASWKASVGCGWGAGAAPCWAGAHYGLRSAHASASGVVLDVLAGFLSERKVGVAVVVKSWEP